MTDLTRVPGDDGLLMTIERAFNTETLREIAAAFVEARMKPSPGVLEAIGTVTGSSHNEVLRFVAKIAQERGSDFLSDHLAAR